MAGASSIVGGRSCSRSVRNSSGGTAAATGVSCRPMNEGTKNGNGPGLRVMLIAAILGGAIVAAVDRIFLAEANVASAQDAAAPGPAPQGPTLEDELKALSAAIAELQKSVDKLAQAPASA